MRIYIFSTSTSWVTILFKKIWVAFAAQYSQLSRKYFWLTEWYELDVNHSFEMVFRPLNYSSTWVHFITWTCSSKFGQKRNSIKTAYACALISSNEIIGMTNNVNSKQQSLKRSTFHSPTWISVKKNYFVSSKVPLFRRWPLAKCARCDRQKRSLPRAR